MSHYRPTGADITRFHEDGYLFVPNLLDSEEIELLGNIARADREMDNAKARKDASGGESRLRLRNECRRIFTPPSHAAAASWTRWRRCLVTRCTTTTTR